MRKPRKGRVRRFFGWIILIVIALAWIEMLSELADEVDIILSIGVALFIWAIPAFVGLLLLSAGMTDKASRSTPPSEPKSGTRNGGFLRFVGWVIVGLTAVAWIVLILDLIHDPHDILGIIVGGLVISVIPLIVAVFFNDGFA